jgi:NAD(P)-dependent dehydrogenase (short-subunit alcohol dehydrogenase family)
MACVLITGANRGVGFEFAQQYAADGWRVIATCRDPDGAAALKVLGPGVERHRLDVMDLAAIRALGLALAHETIDVLIANAGVYIARGMTAERIDERGWLDSFAINTVAPLACAGAFLAQVARSRERKMIAISSVSGSIGGIKSGGFYAYRSSKAALNATWRIFAQDHPEVIATLLSPGQVRTDMNPNAVTMPETNVAGMRRIIAGLTQKASGAVYRFDGAVPPW